MPITPDGERQRIDAKTFQEPLWKMTEALAQKVQREGVQCLRAPDFVPADIFMMMRQAIAT